MLVLNLRCNTMNQVIKKQPILLNGPSISEQNKTNLMQIEGSRYGIVNLYDALSLKKNWNILAKKDTPIKLK